MPKQSGQPPTNANPPLIKDREDLIAHLQTALELEHSTIPPYLCALYSIKAGSNTEAASVIRSVAMEEMLHMTLVSNIMNAVGGHPSVNRAQFVPEYPTYLPHSADRFIVDLRPFSPEAIATFLKIEHPPEPGAAPQPHRYDTIGQFYQAILEGVEYLAGPGQPELFTGDRARQITPEQWYYGGGGTAVVVTDLASARDAIEEVIEQGEGAKGIFDNSGARGVKRELAHYYKFNEISAGRCYLDSDTEQSGPTGVELPIDWSAVHPMRPNPTVATFDGQPETQALMVEFNRVYTRLLDVLHKAFNGEQQLLRDAVPLMFDLKYRAQALMKIPSGAGDGSTAGPSFEYTR